MSKIILATKSPYRQEAFGFLGLDFVAEGSKVEEKFEGRPDNPEELVGELAKLKTEAAAKNHLQGIIIGFDSVGWFESEILEKPESRQAAFERLKRLSGKIFYFYTGINMINKDNDKNILRCVKTEIWLRDLSEEEINRYLEQDSNFNTYALGFDPWGYYSSTFAREIKGSYNNFLRGIPLETIVEMLFEVGYKI